MINKSDILVSTTPSLEGCEIIKYLKPITAHIVIGTNVFSDFIASWTDFLGGQSETYQKKLSESYQLALNEIKSTAFQIGANAVVGLHIDLDEISGKGKSMFMITASGTAVIINYIKTNSVNSTDKTKSTIIPKAEMSAFLKKKKITDQLTTNSLKINEELWEFITNNLYHEIAEDIIKLSVKEYNTTNDDAIILSKLKSYLYALPKEKIKGLLYRIYLEGKYKYYISDLVFEIIQQSSIFNSMLLIKELENLDQERKHRILKLITVPKQFYIKDDVEDFKKLKYLVQDKFPINVEFIKKKRLLSEKEDSFWVCSCGNKNDIDLKYCKFCVLDKYGFKKSSIGPAQAIKYLEGCIEFMETL